jgi:Family of unknown function (DUF5989)
MPLDPHKPSRFEELAGEKQPSLAAEFYGFLKENQKWWLIPILLMIGLFGILVILANSSLAPFIYTMF